MLKRQLKTIDYPKTDNFQPEDPQQFRHVVNWLEAYKLRSGKGFALQDTYSTNWDQEYKKYLSNVDCPLDWYSDASSFNVGTLTWLVGQVVKAQYNEKITQNQRPVTIFVLRCSILLSWPTLYSL